MCTSDITTTVWLPKRGRGLSINQNLRFLNGVLPRSQEPWLFRLSVSFGVKIDQRIWSDNHNLAPGYGMASWLTMATLWSIKTGTTFTFIMILFWKTFRTIETRIRLTMIDSYKYWFNISYECYNKNIFCTGEVPV